MVDGRDTKSLGIIDTMTSLSLPPSYLHRQTWTFERKHDEYIMTDNTKLDVYQI